MTASNWIFDATAKDLPQLVEQSRQQPVLVDFWASWCGPCKQLEPILHKVVDSYQGKLLLARVNADTEQQLAAQFGVRSLPTLKLLWQGQLVDEISGLQTEAALKNWLAPHLDPEAAAAKQIEDFTEQLQAAFEQGQGERAEAAARQLLTERPTAHAIRALLLNWLLASGRLDEARELLGEVTEEVPELMPYKARFALLEKVGKGRPLAQLQAAVAVEKPDPDDLYQYGLSAAASGHFAEGLEALLTLLRDHRAYQDGVARAALLDVLACLPKGDPLASESRRRMFNLLH